MEDVSRVILVRENTVRDLKAITKSMMVTEEWSAQAGRLRNQLKLTKNVCKIRNKEYVSLEIKRAEEVLDSS
jgi:hypothetical protein